MTVAAVQPPSCRFVSPFHSGPSLSIDQHADPSDRPFAATSAGRPDGDESSDPNVVMNGVAPEPRRHRRPVTTRMVVSAILIAAVVAAANWAFWSRINRSPESAGYQGRIGGFAFNGFRRDQSPVGENKTYPSVEELGEDVEMLSKYSSRLRTYSTQDAAAIPQLARDNGMTVMAGAWLSTDRANNDEEIKGLISIIRDPANYNVDRVIVGNETILRGDLSPEQLIDYLDVVRRRAEDPDILKRRSRVLVSTAESWDVWLLKKKEMHEVAKHVDFITVHLLPYWEGVPRAGAVGLVLQRYKEVQREYPNKKVVIGEVGWPSGGSRVAIKNQPADAPITYSTASVTDEAQFIREFLPLAKENNLDYYLMEAIDQPWKRRDEGRTGAYWGIFNADREPKFSFDGPVIPDPAWPRKATVASILALFPIIAFCILFARFRMFGRLFFGLVIQAAVTLVVWLVTLPFEFYLNTLDWTMLALLLPALAAMLMILLANAFEFTEVVWQKHWQRHFRPERPSLDAVEPFVSIHLPCHNEPPEMVIQTLASLARMHYRNFEVLVIDNNTKSEDVWKPVEHYIDRLNEHAGDGGDGTSSPRFRFFHLDNWPGFKAGALNFALGETDPRAEVVGVVDADYVVDQDWLRVTVAHFEAPRVAVVQCPQAHRDWQHNAFQRMTSWEYDGFFRIGMHHRNERDAIIQHGTMTLVRRVALVDTGGWSEWCICEDAELGLRLMNAGWETRYIDEVLGRGLTPSNFSGYKSQRFRWAFGAMQILKRRWNWLWGRQDKQPAGSLAHRPPGLTSGQRFHFLTGWFSWFADALHLFFTLASLAWTVGMLLNPENFSLPLDLFVIPVLGFFVLKAYFGPSLYRVRVPCGWRDVIGASIASMALSHAIARGIIAGLVQKKGTFVVTPKSWQTGKKRSPFAWIGAVREEMLMLVAIIIAAVGVTMMMPTQYESLLWIGILATQAIPYASSVACALISAYAPRRTIRPVGSEGTSDLHSFEVAAVPQGVAMRAKA
jgi:cellulose synthase/poly-beta-1,6-N-acetylglucosamine synthase-like glycosyltransferase/exo-beta-1,3-glucanase (GH17 family)